MSSSVKYKVVGIGILFLFSLGHFTHIPKIWVVDNLLLDHLVLTQDG